MRAALIQRGLIAAGAVWLAVGGIGTAGATVQVERIAHAPRLSIDVWTNKEEGGVYRQGEPMRIFFRPNADAFVLIYNIDTEGYIHLVYPYGPDDPERLQGGRTYQVPSRHDPYDLVADGPTGIEYVVAIASPEPFRNLPWYLSAGYEGPPRDYGEDEEYEETGVVVGDPYVGMDRIVRRVVPPGSEDEVATADTYFYIERRVEYPRYVCADCHSYGGWYDPYVDVCSVVEIRIDATWARYAPLRSRVIRPRYFYTVRSSAPTRYRQWKERWSTLDGRSTLRSRFQVDGRDRVRSRREVIQRRTPPEFRDVRRRGGGRIWRSPEEVLRLRERRLRQDAERERPRVSKGDPRDRREETRDRREEGRQRREDGWERRQENRDRREDRREGWQERRERSREEGRDVRDRGRGRRDDGQSEVRGRERRERSSDADDRRRERGRESDKRSDEKKEKNTDKGDREKDRDDGDRGSRGRGRGHGDR